MATFDIKKEPFRNNPNFGTVTKVKDIDTGLEIDFMGSLSKGEAIKQFRKHFGSY